MVPLYLKVNCTKRVLLCFVFIYIGKTLFELMTLFISTPCLFCLDNLFAWSYGKNWCIQIPSVIVQPVETLWRCAAYDPGSSHFAQTYLYDYKG